MCRGGGLPVRFSVGGRSFVIRPGSGRVVSGMPLTKLIYARTRIVAPQCENRGHAVGDARGGGVVPPGHGAGDLVGADGHTRSDLPHAVRHLLPRAALRNAALDAARLASALSDHSLRRRLFPAAAPRPDGGAGGDDLRAGARGDGRRGDRGHARRQCRHDGHVQPPVQYGRGAAGARRALLCRNGGVFVRRDAGPYRAAARTALRGCAVLPSRAARRCGMGCRP